MSLTKVFILALFLATVCITGVRADEFIVLSAQETEVTVAPRAADLRLVALPAVEFNLRVAVDCSGEAESLTISVADTFTTLKKAHIGDQHSAEASLRVPARQLILAASSNFCTTDEAGTEDLLLVPGFVTAHASLRCAAQESTTIHFASAPLQIRLRCNRGLGESQESSPDK